MEHTKGKWEAKVYTEGKIGWRICVETKEHQICGMRPGVSASGFLSKHEHTANAEFIANAPETLKQRDELLEACKKALEFVGRSSKTDWDNEITPVLEQAIANTTEDKIIDDADLCGRLAKGDPPEV